jgi:hypothetical protein
MSDLDPTPDELEQQQQVVDDEDGDLGDGPFDDEHARADEGDLVEQRQAVPTDDDADYQAEATD